MPQLVGYDEAHLRVTMRNSQMRLVLPLRCCFLAPGQWASRDAFQACLGLALVLGLGLGLGLGLDFGLSAALLFIFALGLDLGRRGVWALGFLDTENPAASSNPTSACSM